MAGIVGNLKTFDDYRRAEEEFQLKKQKAMAERQGSKPATLQVAGAIKDALDRGDVEEANQIMQVHRAGAYGVNTYGDPTGQQPLTAPTTPKTPQARPGLLGAFENLMTPPVAPTARPWQNPDVMQPRSATPMAGVADVIAANAAKKKGAEEQTVKNIQLNMNPQITRAESDQRNASDLNFKPQINKQEKLGNIDAERTKDYTKVESSLVGFKQQAKIVDDAINEANALINKGYATGWGSFLSAAPNSDAGALKNALLTIKTNIGLDKLQNMRDTSPTGGALGNVSDTENKFLQAVNGALDPAQEGQLVNNLKAIKELYPMLVIEKERAFQQDYGSYTPAGGKLYPAEEAAAKADTFAASKKREETSFQLRKKGFTQEQINEYLKAKGL